MQLDLRTWTESPPPAADAVEVAAPTRRRPRRWPAWIVNAVLLSALLLTGTAVVGSIAGLWRAEAVLSASMQPAIHAGDLEILRPEPTTDVTVGQVIAFHPPHQTITVTHRVTAVDQADDGIWVTTKGDANNAADPWGRVRVSGSQVWVVRDVIPKVGSFDVLLKQPAIHLLLLVGVVIVGMAVALDRDLAVMKRHAVSVAVVVIVVAVWGGAAWAASSNTSSGGPVQILSAALSPAPANVAIVNNGCSGNNQRTNLGMAWTDAQSSTLDAAGGYLVTGYAIGRASSSGGTYALAGATSGSPPATVFADAPTVANTPVALVADSGNGAKVVYPVAESTLTVGPSLTIGATGTQVNAIQVSPDGLTAIIAEYTADQVQILTWSGTAWAITKTLAVSNPTAVTISPVANSSGAYVAYVVSDPGTTANSSVYPVVLTGATTTLGSPITVQRQANPTAMTVTANGAWLYVANYNSASVSAVNLATSAVTNISLPGTTPNPIAIASTQDSSHVYVADRRNSTIADIAVASNTVSANIALTAGGLNDAQLTGAGNPNILAMSPSGTALYVAEFGAAQVQVVSTALAATPDTVAASVSTGAGSEPIELAMTPNGCTVYAADWPSDKIFAIATATNAVTTAFTATCETQDPQPMQVTPDNQYLIVPENYRCGDIQILNTSTNAVTTLTGVGNTPAMIAIPPVPVWYRLSATHSQWSSNPSTPTSYPVGWNPGSWR